jgi:hypothetical protein
MKIKAFHNYVNNYANFAAIIFLCGLAMLSCRTSPLMPESEFATSGEIALDPEAFAYIFIDVPNARPIIDRLSIIPSKNKSVRQMLDKTRTAAAAINLEGRKEAGRFQLIAWGEYPVRGARMAFGTNREWKKHRSALTGSNYWYSAKDQLSVGLSQRQAFVSASDEGPRDPFPAGVGAQIPGGFSGFSEGSLLSCWLNNPGPFVNQAISQMGIPLEIPLEQLFITVFAYEGGPDYEARFMMQAPSAAQARALANFFNIARAFMSLNAAGPNPAGADAASMAILSSIMFQSPPKLEGDSLYLSSGPLSAGSIALLFSMFSL